MSVPSGRKATVQRSSAKSSDLLAGNRVTRTVPSEEDPPTPPAWEARLRHDVARGASVNGAHRDV